MSDISSSYFRMPVRDQEIRAKLDSRGIVNAFGELELGGSEASISMHPANAQVSKLPYEEMMHAGINKDMRDEIVRVAALAEEAGRLCPKTAGVIYEAIATLAEAVSVFNSPELKTAVAQRDAKRAKEYGDYWRSKQGKVSRY